MYQQPQVVSNSRPYECGLSVFSYLLGDCIDLKPLISEKVSIQHSPGLRGSDKLQENQGALESVCIKGSGPLWALCTLTWVAACVCAHALVYSYKSKLQPLSCHVYCLKSEVIQSAAWLMNWLEKSTANYPDRSLSRHSAGWSGVRRLNANSPPQSVVGGDCLCVRGVLTLQKLPLPLHGGLGWEMRPAGSSELGS